MALDFINAVTSDGDVISGVEVSDVELSDVVVDVIKSVMMMSASDVTNRVRRETDVDRMEALTCRVVSKFQI